MNYRNRDYFSAHSPLGVKIREALDDIATKAADGFSQVVATPGGVTAPPPQISSLTVQVTKTAGLFDLAIQDNNPVSRGVTYFAEWSLTANFSQPRVVLMGPSRNLSIFLGSIITYWRAYSAYPTSAASLAVYFGSPTAVDGSIVGSATPLTSTGTGTTDSSGTQGNAGFGDIPTRGAL